MNTNYRDVIDNKFEIVAQRNATVKTKPHFTYRYYLQKAKITSLIGLDWMIRLELELPINSNTNSAKIHNIRVDENEKISG